MATSIDDDRSDLLTSDIDQQLLESYRRGAPSAAGEIVARYRPVLAKLIAGRLKSALAPRVDASDIVQDALAEAVRRLPEYAHQQSIPLGYWLRRIAMDRLVMERRKHLEALVRSQRREVDCNSRFLIDGRHSSPSEHQTKIERFHSVQQGINALSDDDQTILHLRIVESLDYRQIGQLLEIEPAAARQRVGRALVRLMSQLVERGLSKGDLC